MNRLQRKLILIILLSSFSIAGCRRAPTFSILGSFFPSWLICLVAGVVIAAVANRVLVRFSIDKEILWPVIVYPCLTLLSACTIWLIFFS